MSAYPPARVVVKPTVYHQLTNQQPTQAQLPTAERQLNTDEQPWLRDFKATPEWQPLKGCWFIEEDKPASLVVLANREGRFTQKTPTPEEREHAAGLVVEVALAPPVNIAEVRDGFSCETDDFTAPPHPPLLLVPGGLLVLEPSDLKGIHLRCLKGIAKVTVCVYPG